MTTASSRSTPGQSRAVGPMPGPRSGGSLSGMDLATRVRTLLDLHHTGRTLVLPTVWDAWSAKVVTEARFPALSIGSHPLDDARDGVRRICAAAPDRRLTADLESGYNTAPARPRKSSDSPQTTGLPRIGTATRVMRTKSGDVGTSWIVS